MSLRKLGMLDRAGLRKIATDCGFDVLEDGALAYFGVERSIDVGGRRHDEAGVFQPHDRDALAVEYCDGAVARAEIEADADFVATLRAVAELRQVESRDPISVAF